MTWGGKTLRLSSKFRKKAVMVYKSLNCLAPDFMSSKFILHSNLFNSYNLRDSENKLVVLLEKKQIGSSFKDMNKLKRVVKACSRFYACNSSLLIKIT